RATAATTLLRQAPYFGLPLGILTVGAYLAGGDPLGDPGRHKARALAVFGAGRGARSLDPARVGGQASHRQTGLEEAMIAVRPSATRYAQLARLIGDRSHARSIMLGSRGLGLPTAEDLRAHRCELERAVRTMEKALALGEPLGSGGRWGHSGMTP